MKHRNSLQTSLRPVVLCPHLCSSDMLPRVALSPVSCCFTSYLLSRYPKPRRRELPPVCSAGSPPEWVLVLVRISISISSISINMNISFSISSIRISISISTGISNSNSTSIHISIRVGPRPEFPRRPAILARCLGNPQKLSPPPTSGFPQVEESLEKHGKTKNSLATGIRGWG